MYICVIFLAVSSSSNMGFPSPNFHLKRILGYNSNQVLEGCPQLKSPCTHTHTLIDAQLSRNDDEGSSNRTDYVGLEMC